MVTKSDVFKSDYLKAADLRGKPWVLTIEAARMEMLQDKRGNKDERLVVYFHETPKKLVINRTNWDVLEEVAGADTEDWPSASVEIYPSTTPFGKEIVDCIRVREPTKAAAKPAKKAKASKADAEPEPDDSGPGSDMDDEIPF